MRLTPQPKPEPPIQVQRVVWTCAGCGYSGNLLHFRSCAYCGETKTPEAA